MGSHLTYALRYPPEFGVFSSTDDIPTKPWRTESEKQYVNTYDNSIRYTDHIVSSVINAVKRKGGDAFVVYFSDHGQEVYDTRPVRGQIANDPSKHMLDIPFLCWFSPEYQRRNRRVHAAGERGHPQTLDDVRVRRCCRGACPAFVRRRQTGKSPFLGKL